MIGDIYQREVVNGCRERCLDGRAASTATILPGHLCFAQELLECHLYGRPAHQATRQCCQTTLLQGS